MATNFLNAPGTNGFIATPFALMGTTDLASLASATGITSTATALTQTSFANAVWCQVFFTALGAFTPAAGGYFTGWWLNSENGGANFERVPNTTTIDIPRSPDFVIPMANIATVSGDRIWAPGLIKTPFGSAKLFFKNYTGGALSTGNHTVTACPVAIQY
jgi:hypothetical protein